MKAIFTPFYPTFCNLTAHLKPKNGIFQKILSNTISSSGTTDNVSAHVAEDCGFKFCVIQKFFPWRDYWWFLSHSTQYKIIRQQSSFLKEIFLQIFLKIGRFHTFISFTSFPSYMEYAASHVWSLFNTKVTDSLSRVK